MIQNLCTIIVLIELFIALWYGVDKYLFKPLKHYSRRAYFKILRENRVYRIYKKILFWYKPIVEVRHFTDCLQFFSNYCTNTYHNNIKVLNESGTDKVVSITYDKKIDLRGFPRYDIIIAKPLDSSILSYYDRFKQYIINKLL